MLKSERRRAEATVNANNDEVNEHGGRERPKHFEHFTKQFDKMHFVQSAFATTERSQHTPHYLLVLFSYCLLATLRASHEPSAHFQFHLIIHFRLFFPLSRIQFS